MENNYKNTLLMMNTDFKMKANLPNKEPNVLKMWEDDDIYHKALEQNKGNMNFILHDGPPYANGNIHLGHALNKIIKDFMVRYKTMQGFYSPYIPGWDTHGLPIETALTKKLKVNRKTIPVADFRDMCYDYALKQVDNQREQFKRLGILADWDNPYITLTKDYEAAQIQVFAKMAQLGLIYKGLKPVYWSPSSETALAEAEIEYHDVTSDSIYLAFKVVDGKGILDKDDELVIWTTTPWTIPANEAVCVNPTYVYSVISCMGRRLVIAKDLVNDFTSMLNADYTLIKDVKGRDMELITYINPMDKICPVCLGNHVTLGEGTTGLVHTAPGYGEDDFFIGKQYGLEIFAPVNDKGVLTEGNGEFSGLYYDAANKAIITSLEERKILLYKKEIVHSYPHDWRTKKPIIFRATPQWFASIEGMKDDMLTAIKNVKWKPAWGELRLTNMVKDRKEWCISRQRAWGVPIPVFYAEDGTPILNQSVMLHISELLAEHGSGIWFR
ncbi:MAG: class I tRNA ligase family protein, partial [Bacilli bacterium]